MSTRLAGKGCGRRCFGSELLALKAVGKGADGIPVKCTRCPWWHLDEPPRHTGFSPAVKLQVCTRAGNGDPLEARCESCGMWLGRLLGEVQHIVARGMGGTSLAVMNSAANGALLCGSVVYQHGCHWLAETRDAGMEAKGFFIRGRQDPRLVSMMLFSAGGSGLQVWRSEDGQYLYRDPREVAA